MGSLSSVWPSEKYRRGGISVDVDSFHFYFCVVASFDNVSTLRMCRFLSATIDLLDLVYIAKPTYFYFYFFSLSLSQINSSIFRVVPNLCCRKNSEGKLVVYSGLSEKNEIAITTLLLYSGCSLVK